MSLSTPIAVTQGSADNGGFVSGQEFVLELWQGPPVQQSATGAGHVPPLKSRLLVGQGVSYVGQK